MRANATVVPSADLAVHTEYLVALRVSLKAQRAINVMSALIPIPEELCSLQVARAANVVEAQKGELAFSAANASQSAVVLKGSDAIYQIPVLHSYCIVYKSLSTLCFHLLILPLRAGYSTERLQASGGGGDAGEAEFAAEDGNGLKEQRRV
jgi:hypothetical protein